MKFIKNSSKWTIFGIFNQLLSTQNVNVARFARNVECDFFCDFQTLWIFQVRRGAKLRYASLTYPKGHPYPHDARSSSSPFQDLAD